MSAAHFSSAAYWEARYRAGGHSGAGSYGRLADFKAAFINGLVAANRIASVLDLGCGDGNLLSLLRVPAYTGVDVAPSTLAACTARFAGRTGISFLPYDRLEAAGTAELGLSIDVIYHLIEDTVFAGYMGALFGHASRFVLIYASNVDLAWPSPHVRHRRFSDHVAWAHPDWRLLAHVPNRYPFDPARPEDTSFADFYLFGRSAEPCTLAIPEIVPDRG
jgi:SAM-dependent methyltransferase